MTTRREYLQAMQAVVQDWFSELQADGTIEDRGPATRTFVAGKPHVLDGGACWCEPLVENVNPDFRSEEASEWNPETGSYSAPPLPGKGDPENDTDAQDDYWHVESEPTTFAQADAELKAAPIVPNYRPPVDPNDLWMRHQALTFAVKHAGGNAEKQVEWAQYYEHYLRTGERRDS